MPERDQHRVRIRSGFQLGFVMILGQFWEYLGSQHRSNIDANFECFLGRVLGGPSENFGGLGGYNWREGGPGEGQGRGKTPTQRDVGCRIETGL